MTGHTPVADCAELPIALQIWLSPSFPVGSFAYSHGLEWAAGTDRIRDRASTEAWLRDLLGHGAPRNDAILLAAAWRAMDRGEDRQLASINDLALALAGSRERHLETTMQGNAFVAMVEAAWDGETARRLRRTLTGDIAYPVAVGATTAARGNALTSVLPAYLTATVQNLVSALVRLSVIGQTDGQRVIAALSPAMAAAASHAALSGLDDLGGAAFLSDIAAMAHETQETRLFRT